MLRLELEYMHSLNYFWRTWHFFLILVFNRHVESCDGYRKITSKQNSHGRTAQVSTQPDLFSFLKYLLGSRICKNSQQPTVFHTAQASSPFKLFQPTVERAGVESSSSGEGGLGVAQTLNTEHSTLNWKRARLGLYLSALSGALHVLTASEDYTCTSTSSLPESDPKWPHHLMDNQVQVFFPNEIGIQYK